MAIPDEPLTRTEQYLNRTATGGGTIPEEPLTRVEMYLNKIATGSDDTPEQPLTRLEQYLDYIAENGGGGGGGDITLRTLNVSQNGTTNAPSGEAYNKVVANVPNSYAASDEGKVVSNGSLVSQTAHAEVTANGTIDTTLNNSVTVNVPQGVTPTGTKTINITENGTTTEDVAAFVNAEITVNVPSGGGDYVAADWLDPTKPVGDIVSDANFTNQYNGQYLLAGRKNLGVVHFTRSQFLPVACLQSSGVTTFVGEKVSTIGGFGLKNTSRLTKVDVLGIGNNGETFVESAIDTIIIRGTAVTPIYYNAFNAAAHFKNGGSGGTIYIPKALYDHLGDGTSLDYKAATNWSTFDGYGTITWAAIEGSIYETQYADGTPIPSA